MAATDTSAMTIEPEAPSATALPLEAPSTAAAPMHAPPDGAAADPQRSAEEHAALVQEMQVETFSFGGVSSCLGERTASTCVLVYVSASAEAHAISSHWPARPRAIFCSQWELRLESRPHDPQPFARSDSASIQEEFFADDIEPPPESRSWSIEMLRSYFDSGGAVSNSGTYVF